MKIEFELCDYLDRVAKYQQDVINLREEFEKDRQELLRTQVQETRNELEKRIEATYATIREVDSKIERRDTKLYTVMFAVFGVLCTVLIATFALLGAAILAHVLGKL